MAIRIVGVDLPQNKRGEIALTYIYGIGRSASKSILDKAGIDRDIKVKDWTDDQAAKVREVIGADLPLRGQSTKNNARTRKGKKKTVANKKKATK